MEALPGWSIESAVVVPALAAAALYAVGWRTLARRMPERFSAPRAIAFMAGLAIVLGASCSPLDALGHQLLLAHMIQHMLLIVVAAPALLLADPFPIVVWALPVAARRRVGRWITRASALGRLWRGATAMRPAWIVSACVLWTWHVPRAYDAALASRFLHDVEHVSFFVGALVFWWPLIHPAPRFRRAPPYPLRVVYLVLGAFQTAALGLWLTLAPAELYRSYAGAARPGGLGALDDQMWGGIVMWGLGGSIDMIAVLILVHRSLGGLATGPPSPPDARSSPGEPGTLLEILRLASGGGAALSGRASRGGTFSPTATRSPGC